MNLASISLSGYRYKRVIELITVIMLMMAIFIEAQEVINHTPLKTHLEMLSTPTSPSI